MQSAFVEQLDWTTEQSRLNQQNFVTSICRQKSSVYIQTNE